ncbi:hypothetical protein [Kitasatospora sp. NPDC002965]|uniref:hypothetical protein n=1 Tax=Kitasatospora sp. NPDC002965 TaxID=3154775 RepID=UPI0033B4CE3F
MAKTKTPAPIAAPADDSVYVVAPGISTPAPAEQVSEVKTPKTRAKGGVVPAHHTLMTLSNVAMVAGGSLYQGGGVGGVAIAAGAAGLIGTVAAARRIASPPAKKSKDSGGAGSTAAKLARLRNGSSNGSTGNSGSKKGGGLFGGGSRGGSTPGSSGSASGLRLPGQTKGGGSAGAGGGSGSKGGGLFGGGTTKDGGSGSKGGGSSKNSKDAAGRGGRVDAGKSSGASDSNKKSRKGKAAGTVKAAADRIKRATDPVVEPVKKKAEKVADKAADRRDDPVKAAKREAKKLAREAKQARKVANSPKAAEKKAERKRKAKHAGRMTKAGVLATGGGLWNTLWNLITTGKPVGFFKAFRIIWKRRAEQARAENDAAKAGGITATKVDDPGNTPAAGSTSSTTTTAPATTPELIIPRGAMSAFANNAQQVQDAYSRYSAPSMMSVWAEYKGLPSGIRAAAVAVLALATNTSDKYPASKKVAAQVGAVYALVLQAAKVADEIGPNFGLVHDHDIMRHVAPRNGFTGEQMWNLGAKRGDGSTGNEVSVFELAAQATATTYTRYSPPDMIAVGVEYNGLPTGLEAIAAAVQHLATRSADNFPVDPRIAEMVGAVARLLRAAASAAAQITPLFRREHATDISNHEKPRNGPAAESMWNV